MKSFIRRVRVRELSRALAAASQIVSLLAEEMPPSDRTLARELIRTLVAMIGRAHAHSRILAVKAADQIASKLESDVAHAEALALELANAPLLQYSSPAYAAHVLKLVGVIAEAKAGAAKMSA